MRKALLLALVITATVLTQSCNKSNAVSPSDPTNTPTFTATATATPTQATQTHFYDFETGTDGWVNQSAHYGGFDGLGLSVAQNTNAAYCDGGSSGSLQLNTNFGLSQNFYAITSYDFSTIQDLSYHTLSARIYIPAGLATATNPVNVVFITWDGISDAAIMSTWVDIITPGWMSLQWQLNSAWGLSSWQHVKQIAIVFNKPNGSTVSYSGSIYIDHVAW